MKQKKADEGIWWCLSLQNCQSEHAQEERRKSSLLETVGLTLFHAETWSEIFQFPVSLHAKVFKS